MTRRLSGLVLIALLAIGSAPLMHAADRRGAASKHEAYDDEEIAKAASDSFSTGAKGLSDVLAKVLKEKGRPIAYIRGEEIGGAVAVGLRYG
jgi:hypothetical protein